MMSTTRALLSHCIDYAGLFPPALLDLQTVIQNYNAYRTGPRAWALGRLILPANKVVEFAETWPSFATEWPISLLVGVDFETELRVATDHGISLDVLECKFTHISEIATIRRLAPAATTIYIEVPTSTNPEESIAAIAVAGARAKVRTGGTVRSAIPPTSDLTRFVSCCVRYRVPFKATAGLHHPFRAVHPLTYEAQSDSAVMHGFANVILASAILKTGGDGAEAIAMLEDESSANFKFDHEYVHWRDWSITEQQIVDLRKELVVSFGSCSFTEPLDEIESMGSLS